MIELQKLSFVLMLSSLSIGLSIGLIAPGWLSLRAVNRFKGVFFISLISLTCLGAYRMAV